MDSHNTIRQRKGEEELAQADWLPYVAQELEEDDSVICYVTSGDIDVLPIHMLAAKITLPNIQERRLPNPEEARKAHLTRYMYIQMYVVTKIIEFIEQLYRSKEPGRVAQSVTCLSTDACLTADPGVASSIPARYHTFVEIDHEIISTVILLPSADLFKKGCCQLQAKVCAQITG